MAQHGHVGAGGNSVTSLTRAVSPRSRLPVPQTGPPQHRGRRMGHRLVGGLLVAVTASGAAVRRTV
jgi:hypothetical protein